MYTALINIFKIFSYAVTAGCGLLGLLTEFKDEHKQITRAGKLVLTGIIVGFCLSTTMTILDIANSRSIEIRHREEIKRLARPIGDIEASFRFSIDTRKSYKYLLPVQDVVKKQAASYGSARVTGFSLRYKDVQHTFYDPDSPLEQTSALKIDVFSSPGCK